MTTSLVRRLRVGVAAACIAVAVAACGTGAADVGVEPSVTPSASPSPSPTLDEAEVLKQAQIETAKALVVEYYALVDDVAHASHEGWEVLLEFWGPDLTPVKAGIFQEAQDLGERTTGSAVVVSQTLVEHRPAEGRESVLLDVCVDFSGVRGFRADGTEDDLSGGPRRYVIGLLVQRQQGDYWTIDEETPYPERTC